MSPMRIIILLVAAAAAILAAVMVRSLASQPSQTEMVTAETVIEVEVSETQVLIANRDLSLGDVLAPEDLLWAPWPEEAVNIDYYTEELAPDAIEELAGSVVRMNIYTNEPLLPQKLVSRGDHGFMAALLAPGMRAVSVEISTETASGGFIVPNDRVDVIMTYEAELKTETGTEDYTVGTIILENARVLAIDQIFRQDDTNGTAIGSVATLQLSPAQAELLSMAERRGVLSLALRSVADALEAGDVVTTKMEMLDYSNDQGGNSITVYRSGQPSRGGS